MFVVVVVIVVVVDFDIDIVVFVVNYKVSYCFTSPLANAAEA